MLYDLRRVLRVVERMGDSVSGDYEPPGYWSEFDRSPYFETECPPYDNRNPSHPDYLGRSLSETDCYGNPIKRAARKFGR